MSASPDTTPSPEIRRLGGPEWCGPRWERSDDGASWQPWMDMTFTRMP